LGSVRTATPGAWGWLSSAKGVVAATPKSFTVFFIF
jgi:hypothetical protein